MRKAGYILDDELESFPTPPRKVWCMSASGLYHVVSTGTVSS